MSSSPFSGSTVLEGTLNLLCRLINSVEGGGGMAAMVGANRRGSLALRETFLVTISISSILACKILARRTGTYSYPFSAFSIFRSHCFVCWLYFLDTTCSPVLLLAVGRLR